MSLRVTTGNVAISSKNYKPLTKNQFYILNLFNCKPTTDNSKPEFNTNDYSLFTND